MKLTEDQIKDLESRGIKPGVLLISAFSINTTIFEFDDWDEFELEVDASIGSRLRMETDRGLSFVWLFDGDTKNYATPIT